MRKHARCDACGRSTRAARSMIQQSAVTPLGGPEPRERRASSVQDPSSSVLRPRLTSRAVRRRVRRACALGTHRDRLGARELKRSSGRGGSRFVRSARKRDFLPPTPPYAAPRFHDDHEKQDESRAERLILEFGRCSRASEPCLAEPRSVWRYYRTRRAVRSRTRRGARSLAAERRRTSVQHARIPGSLVR